jgi:hypothetical protein
MTIPRLGSANSILTPGSVEEGTCKDGQDGLVDGLDLPRLEHVTGEQGDDEKHDENEERP